MHILTPFSPSWTPCVLYVSKVKKSGSVTCADFGQRLKLFHFLTAHSVINWRVVWIKFSLRREGYIITSVIRVFVYMVCMLSFDWSLGQSSVHDPPIKLLCKLSIYWHHQAGRIWT